MRTYDELLLEEVVLNFPEHIFWKDAKMRYRGCNEQFAHAIGLSDPTDIIGKTDLEMPWGPVLGANYQSEDIEILKTLTPIVAKKVPISFPGNPNRIILVSKSPLVSSDGSPLGILGIYVDVTEQENLLASLENALKSKARFIENMSHDIRTPLTGILGLVDTLKSLCQGEKEQKAIGLIEHSVCQLFDLLNDIIDVSHSDANLEINLVKFSLNALISSVVDLVKPASTRKKLKLKVHVDSKIPPLVVGDHMKIYRCLLNVLSNAIKFTDQGSITIRCQVVNHTKHNLTVMLKVSDTGIGIEKEKIAEVFERFTRVTPSYLTDQHGSGLGLAIVKRFTEMLGGEVSLDSKLGMGTTVKMTLTLAKLVDENLNQSSANQGINPLNEMGVRHKAKFLSVKPKGSEINLLSEPVAFKPQGAVLLVEDDELSALAAMNVLKKLDCSVDWAQDASSAKKCAEETSYDLILMDIGLPGASGYEVSTAIRNNRLALSQYAPIVALTAHQTSDNLDQFVKHGMQSVIAKPLSKATAEVLLSLLHISEKKRISLAQSES